MGMLADGLSEKKEKNPHAVHLGQLGGRARIKKMTSERRQEIARNAARIRWAKERREKTVFEFN
jgi:hypothetical protein